jgi:HAD superfamily hydrolase (TIGR01549 family)
MRIESIFFDIGSTLVTGPNLSPNKEIAKILNLSYIDADQIKKIIMREEFQNPEEVCERLRSLWSELNFSHEEKIKDLWYRQENEAQEMEGATEVIQYLKSQGYKIGLISDIWVPYYKSFEKICPKIATLVDSATLSFREGLKKPHPGLFEKALSSLKTEPNRAVMVGDTYKNDIRPAIQLGMVTVWVLSRVEQEDEALVNVMNGKWPKPDYTIEHIKFLMDLDVWKRRS